MITIVQIRIMTLNGNLQTDTGFLEKEIKPWTQYKETYKLKLSIDLQTRAFNRPRNRNTPTKSIIQFKDIDNGSMTPYMNLRPN